MLYKEACGFLRGVGTQNGAVLSFSILVYILRGEKYVFLRRPIVTRKKRSNHVSNFNTLMIFVDEGRAVNFKNVLNGVLLFWNCINYIHFDFVELLYFSILVILLNFNILSSTF